MSDFQFADIIFLAVIAVFVVLRLRNTLGKDVGIDPRQTKHAASAAALRVETATMKDITPVVEDEDANALPNGDLAHTIQAIKVIDPTFSLTNFKHGARTAFEWIFEAFHKGDKAALKPLLAADIYADFESAIDARMAEKQTSDSTLVKIHATDVQLAALEGKKARISVKFDSEQVHVTRNAAGEVVEGNANQFIQVHDEWVFERDLTNKSPNWMVIDT